jgi:hypothetical protein
MYHHLVRDGASIITLCVIVHQSSPWASPSIQDIQHLIMCHSPSVWSSTIHLTCIHINWSSNILFSCNYTYHARPRSGCLIHSIMAGSCHNRSYACTRPLCTQTYTHTHKHNNICSHTHAPPAAPFLVWMAAALAPEGPGAAPTLSWQAAATTSHSVQDHLHPLAHG